MADGVRLPAGYALVDNADPGDVRLPPGYRIVDDKPAEKTLSWADVPGKAVSNLLPSAGNFVSALAHPIMHPVQTVQDIGDVATGALRAGAKKVLPEGIFNAIDATGDQEAKKRAADKAAAVGQFYVDRYGSSEGFKKALATDPVGVAADAAMVLTGGAPAVVRAGGAAANAGNAIGGLTGRAVQAVGNATSRVGGMAQTVGNALDPLANAGRLVARGGRAVADSVGVATGTGARPIEEAFRSGRNGVTEFADNMRDDAHLHLGDAVDLAESAVGQMGRARSQAYQTNMAATNASQTPLSTRPVDFAVNQAFNDVHFNGVAKDAAAAGVVNEIAQIVDTFKNIPNGAGLTPSGFDAMKQAVGEVRQRTQQGTLARRVADQVYRDIRGTIERQVPDYAQAMRDYAGASDQINEMRRTLSINDRASMDTTLRKLQSTMRNNVQANYGQRERLLDELAQHEPTLPGVLAGQAMNAWAPRGLARFSTHTGALLGLGAMNPMALAAVPFSSPRIVGEAAYALGRGAGAVDRFGRSMPNALMQSLPNPMNAARASYAVNALMRDQ